MITDTPSSSACHKFHFVLIRTPAMRSPNVIPLINRCTKKWYRQITSMGTAKNSSPNIPSPGRYNSTGRAIPRSHLCGMANSSLIPMAVHMHSLKLMIAESSLRMSVLPFVSLVLFCHFWFIPVWGFAYPWRLGSHLIRSIISNPSGIAMQPFIRPFPSPQYALPANRRKMSAFREILIQSIICVHPHD